MKSKTRKAAGKASLDPLVGCPFCGNRVRIKVRRYVNTREVYAYRIRCRCGMQHDAELNFWTGPRNAALKVMKTELVKWWNTRANARSQALREKGVDHAETC